MRNCGERTFPNAMNAATDAAPAVRRPSRPRSRAAKTAYTTPTATSWNAVSSEAIASGSDPARFWEPWELVTVAS